MANLRLGIIGAGNMGAALAGGILSKLPGTELRASEPSEARRRWVEEQFAIPVNADNAALCEFASVLVLCTKPQLVDDVLGEIQPNFTRDKLLISVCAGVTCERIEQALGNGSRVVRAMPNTPALVGAGATAIASGRHATSDDRDQARRLFESVGTCVDVPERLMDAVTGLSGSGPAYVLLVLEGLVAGGVEVGLTRDVALQLALQTLLGTARMAIETGEHPAVLRDRVTSPGGTTSAGLRALESFGLRHALIEAVSAATERSAELGTAPPGKATK
jgi:pyrroline-5-carboxylate reductase